MIKIACLSYNNVILNNFFHDELALDYYNDLDLIIFEKYKVFILLNSNDTVDVRKVLSKVKKRFTGIIYLLDYKYQEDIMNDCFSLGINDYLIMPLDNNYLISKIINDIRLIKHDYLTYYEYKTLKFDLLKDKLLINNEPVVLTKIEYDILKVLCENVNNTLSKKELSYKVWGYDLDDYRTIETHIKTLRKKLRDYKNNIVTIWGYGYSFME